VSRTVARMLVAGGVLAAMGYRDPKKTAGPVVAVKIKRGVSLGGRRTCMAQRASTDWKPGVRVTDIGAQPLWACPPRRRSDAWHG
jgi:hypothetical protein